MHVVSNVKCQKSIYITHSRKKTVHWMKTLLYNAKSAVAKRGDDVISPFGRQDSIACDFLHFQILINWANFNCHYHWTSRRCFSFKEELLWAPTTYAPRQSRFGEILSKINRLWNSLWGQIERTSKNKLTRGQKRGCTVFWGRGEEGANYRKGQLPPVPSATSPLGSSSAAKAFWA